MFKVEVRVRHLYILCLKPDVLFLVYTITYSTFHNIGVLNFIEVGGGKYLGAITETQKLLLVFQKIASLLIPI